MKKYLYLLTLLSLLFSCNPVHKILSGGHIKETSFTGQIPFSFNYGVPIVKVNINGKNYNFLFDTGAATVISPQLSKLLNLQPATKSKTSDSQGNSNQQEFVVIPNMQLGKLNFENIGAVVIDMTKVFEFKCMGFDGIIGANQMAKAVWQIDYQKKIITATDNIANLNIPVGTQTLDFEPWSTQKTPKVKVKIGAKSVYATFDTGATIDFNLNFDHFKTELLTYKSIEAVGNTNTGIYGTSKSSSTIYAKIPSFSIGNLQVQNQIATFSYAGSELIGNTFFKNYKVILNWQENKIYMINQVDLADAKLESFGISFRYVNNTPTISKIFKNTPAAETGLLINDKVIAIDEKDTSILTTAEACFYAFNNILKDKKTVSITILRDDKKLTYQLKRSVVLE